MDVEKFTEIGGVRLDFFNATWPFAEIVITREKIKLKVLWIKYEFEKNQIIGLREYNEILSKGLIIEHNKRNYFHHIVFWSFSFKRLKGLLKCWVTLLVLQGNRTLGGEVGHESIIV